jgi:predicted ThiF/HesA family dinucleotide-utilizing enzyme
MRGPSGFKTERSRTFHFKNNFEFKKKNIQRENLNLIALDVMVNNVAGIFNFCKDIIQLLFVTFSSL